MMTHSAESNHIERLSLPAWMRSKRDRAWPWLLGLMIILIGCQLALLVPALAPARILFRSATFGASLLFLAIPGRGKGHPAAILVPIILLIMAFGLFHPNTNSMLSGVAQIALNAAILAPLLWARRLPIREITFSRLLFVFWGFNLLSSFVGLLQVYFPGHFQPPISSVINQIYHDSLKISLASGSEVFRPMGLTDMPGGAATAGMYTTIFGLMFFLTSKRIDLRALALSGMAVGFFCIYLSQVRSVLLMTGICCLVLLFVLAYRGDYLRTLYAGGIFGGIVVVSLTWAIAVGGNSVTSRLESLFKDDASTVYYSNRGRFLEHTVNELLPEHPLGAGLGRWGMMHNYFGTTTDPNSKPIWVEIMWTGWLLDGGIPLLIAYPAALLIACVYAWRVATSALPGAIPMQAATVLAYNMGAIAITFSYPYFIGQGGLEFWLLNATLFGAATFAKNKCAWQKVLRT